MVKPEYIHKLIKDKGYNYWVIYNAEKQPVEAQTKAISAEESCAEFTNWYENMLSGTYTIKLFERNPYTTSGTLVRNIRSVNYDFTVNPTLREKSPLPPVPGDSGLGALGFNNNSLNPWVDRFLEVKETIAGLNVQLENNRLKEDYERRIREMEAAHAKELESKANAWEERIMAIASTVAPDLLKGFMQKPINGLGETETNNENDNMAQDAKARILAAVNKLIEKDPNFTENIEKLAKLVEKNPATYQQAVKMLNSFV
jgi:hypothetical protein